MPGSLVGETRPRVLPRRPVLLALVSLYGLLAVVVALVGRHLGPKVFWLAAVAPVVTVVYAAVAGVVLADDGAWTESWSWVPELGLEIDFRLDRFALLLVVLVGVIGVFVFGYAASYFHDGPELPRTAAVLLAFAGSMLGLVMSENLLLMFGFWELTSITSFLLVGTNDEMPSARSAALHALLITGGGGLAMLGGLVLIGQAAGTYALSEIVASPPEGTTVTVGVALVLLGALTKSAQVPFHSWLPGAMAAPTPISAYLHSATMVKAGVFLVARFSPAFATLGVWRWMVLGAGAASLILGGYRALRQHDIKLVLAYGTISQLGLLMLLFGAGTEETALAGCALLLAHAAFKASLFLTVGIVDHQTHTRDLRSLSGLGRRWPVVAGAAALAAASMAGLPPLFGFIAKEYALKGYLEPAAPAHVAVLVAIVVGSTFTVAYSARFLWGAFGPSESEAPNGTIVGADAPHPSVLFAGAPVVLAAIGLVLGLAPMLADPLVGGGVEALGYLDAHVSLHLWSGFNAALGLSALIIAGGAVLFVLRRPVEAVQARVPHVPSALRAYERALAGLLQGSGRLTAVTQSGSLPVYLAVIVLTAVVVPLGPLLSVGGPDRWPALLDSPVQLVLAAIVVVAALATAGARRRFVAVLLLGAVGYAVVGLFLVQGAPDLALTQVLVETLSIVAFVLVLRHLPERFASVRVPLRRLIPATVGVLVGAFVFVFLMTASGVRDTDLSAAGATASAEAGTATLSEQFLARAELEADGRNVVNVVLVDFRGFDTMGEITVLFVAALGVVALVAAGRRGPGEEGPEEGPSGPVPVDQSVDVPEPGSAKVEAGGV